MPSTSDPNYYMRGNSSGQDIVALIGEYVPLVPTGTTRVNYKAICPNHNNGADRTPSLYVFPDSQRWQCFGGCHARGDYNGFLAWWEETHA